MANTDSGPNVAGPKRAEVAPLRRAIEEEGRFKPTPAADSLQSARSGPARTI